MEDLGVEGKNNIKKDVKRSGLEGVDWVYLDQGREERQAVVRAVTKFLVTKDVENSLTG